MFPPLPDILCGIRKTQYVRVEVFFFGGGVERHVLYLYKPAVSISLCAVSF
jgi:hypothetical protein